MSMLEELRELKRRVAELEILEKPGVAYGEIYVSDGSTAQTGISTTPVKVTGFDTDGVSYRTTVSNSSDQITILDSGVYFVNFTCSFSGTVSTQFTFKLRIDAVESEIGFEQDVDSAGDIEAGSFTAIRALTANEVLTVYVEGDGASKSVTPIDMYLTVMRVR